MSTFQFSSPTPDQCGSSATRVLRVNGIKPHPTQDQLAIEEPLEIRLEFGSRDSRIKQSVSITMRTPGYDFELAAGFLLSEGIVQGQEQVREISYCGADLEADTTTNTVRVSLQESVSLDLSKLKRHFYTTSSCGVCGKSSIEALRSQSLFTLEESRRVLNPQQIHALPDALRKAQEIFDSTGGLHACALFDFDGNLLLSREDVGRHNALDKLSGRAFLDGMLPLKNTVLMVSGRASFELIQKASMAGIPIFAAVGAPSSLAVELAHETGMTLLGFVRNERFNLYTHPERIFFATEKEMIHET